MQDPLRNLLHDPLPDPEVEAVRARARAAAVRRRLLMVASGSFGMLAVVLVALEPRTEGPDMSQPMQPAHELGALISQGSHNPSAFCPIMSDSGWVGMYAPQSMRVGESGDIDLLVSREYVSPVTVHELLRRPIRDDVRSQRVASRLQAKLTAPQFDVDTVAPSDQTLRCEETFHWRWRVTPTSAGPLKVDAALWAVVVDPTGPTSSAVRFHDRVIDVKYSIARVILAIIREHWSAILTVILIPLIGSLVARWTSRSRRAKPPNPPDHSK